MTEATFEPLIVKNEGSVGVLQLHRPKVHNALTPELRSKLAAAAEALTKIRIGILILGSERAFAAGADIADMAPVPWPT